MTKLWFNFAKPNYFSDMKVEASLWNTTADGLQQESFHWASVTVKLKTICYTQKSASLLAGSS